MDFSLFLTIVAVAIGFFVIRRFRFNPENDETDSPPPSSLCSVSLSPPPSLSTSPPSLSPSSVLPSSSSSHNSSHDVFPSFRGEDIRRNFLSHIQKEFQSKAITYFNDNGIERGESIGPELIKAIRGSKIAIVLLSKNYASSKWCLDELVEIMKCKETVIPVFYKVDPSDVKKLTGYFGEVFRKTCEGKSMEDTEKWRQALEKVATVAGYDSSNWVNEAAMIEEIATNVSKKLITSVPSSDFDSFVGMRAHMKSMELLFRLDSDEVRMIGIWGPSGIGKSTIARSLFSQHSGDFQLSVFMDNIKRDYPRHFDRYGAQLQLQTKFLSLILNQKDVTIHHLGVAQDRLKDKKVLVVLDDVDHSAQLDALAKETRWFGLGSRIIVTTQDKRILNAHRINHIYEVGFPHDDEALEIFCMNAFDQKSPYDGFRNLAGEVTRLVGKLPLGLSVMGSYFKGLSKEVWERELPRLRTRLNGDIENTLKFSYEVLCDEEQDLFLHIACFFSGERMDKVEEFLAEKFVAVEGLLRVLTEKSLISIDEWGYIKMHDLLARLGREIVRKQSPNEPGQRQFLVDDGDIRQVLRDDTLGGRSVIAINFQPEIELNISHRAFERMSNVQFLRLHSHYFRHSNGRLSSPYILEIVNCLPREVRLLHWIKFPLTCLPSSFNPEFLVEINMRYSNLEKLWEGNKVICNLKWMDLSHSKNLKELPNLSSATNLLELDLSCCSSLVELPFSTGNLTKLKNLTLKLCSSLMELPSSIGNMTNLENLDLSECSNLTKLPSSIGNLTKLKNLTLKLCSSLMELPSSIGNLTNLENLDLSGCSSLVGFPFSIGNMTNLKKLFLKQASRSTTESSYLHRRPNLVELPSSIGNLTNLENLDLFGCSSLAELPSSIGNLTNLENLDLSGCSSLAELPSSIGNMTNLENLDLFGCSSLAELPSSIGNMINLKKLSLQMCSSLAELPSSIGNMTNLENLDLSQCSSLAELPSSIGNMTSIEKLNLNGCSSLVELPSSIGNLTNLIRLDLYLCSSLVELPSSIGNLRNLQKLSMFGCSKLKALPININMKSLDELDLTYCSSMKSFPEISTNIRVLEIKGTAIEDIPASINSWSRLERLHVSYSENLGRSQHAFNRIRELHLNDKGIEEIAPWVKEMSCLEKLVIEGCSNLQNLSSSIGNLTNLKDLDLTECSSLVELPSSIGNLTNLENLNLRNCSSLTELPSSIGNLHNLKKLDLTKCSSLVELPSSIGNLHNLKELGLRGCSKLMALPVNVNMKSLDDVDLTDCSLLKSFPEISTNILVLKINGTAIEEIPQSIGSWPCLDSLSMSYSEKLKKSQHAFHRITELHLADTEIQEIAPWVKDMSRLHKLIMKGCTKLVSLPQLPDSLETIDAENCESLERLDCSFYRIKFTELSFVNCFKLNQEAIDILLNTSTKGWAAFPGEKVPTYFSYRATGRSVSMKLNGLDTRFPTSLRFKACILLVSKGDVEVGAWYMWAFISYCINGKVRDSSVYTGYIHHLYKLCPRSEHLLVIEFEETVTSPESVFEFRFDNEDWEIKECGLLPLESLARSC